jgi:hypothetical protein
MEFICVDFWRFPDARTHCPTSREKPICREIGTRDKCSEIVSVRGATDKSTHPWGNKLMANQFPSESVVERWTTRCRSGSKIHQSIWGRMAAEWQGMENPSSEAFRFSVPIKGTWPWRVCRWPRFWGPLNPSDRYRCARVMRQPVRSSQISKRDQIIFKGTTSDD